MKKFLALVLALSLLTMSMASAETVGYIGELVAANPDSKTWSPEDAISVLQQEFARGKEVVARMPAEKQIEESQFWYDLQSIKNVLFSNLEVLSSQSSKAMAAALKAQVKAVATAEKAFFAAVDKKNAKKFAVARDDWLDLVTMVIQSHRIAAERLGISIPDTEYVQTARWDIY